MRFLIRGIVILVVAVIVAIGGLLMLPGDHIAQIAATQISKQTGRDVSISSDSSISLYPTLGITTGRAVVGTTDWATEGPLFETDGLAIGLDVPALLTGTIRISKLEATAPRITLEKGEDGRANWEFFPASATTNTAPQETTTTEGEGGSYDFSLEKAVIKNATLRYVDKQSGTVQAFEGVDLQVSWPSADSAAVIDIGAAPFGERIDLNATVSDVMGIAAGMPTTLSGLVKTGDAEIGFAGSASIAPNAAMQITMTASDLGQVLRAAGQSPVALGLADDFAPSLALKGDVSFDGTRLALRGLDATLDDSTVKGDADVVLGEVLQAAAKLKVDLKNLGELMRIAGQPPQAFGMDAAFNPNLSSDIVAQMSGTQITAKLTSLAASLEDTKVTGDADMSLSGSTPNISANLRISAPDVARIATLAGQPLTSFGLSPSAAPSFSGSVNAQMKGSAITAKITDMSATLTGAQASGTVNFGLSGGAPTAAGQIKANVPSTANLMQALGQSPASIPRGFGQAISANTAFAYSGSTLSLSDLTVSLDQNTLAGAVNVDLGSAVPNINATLSAGALDFSSLSGGEGDTSNSSSSQGWPKEPIDASALGLINGTIALAANSIDMGMMKLGRTKVGVAIDNSRAVVTLSELAAFQGAIAGQFVANNRSGLSVSAKLNVNSIALKPMLNTFAGIDKISGTATAAVDVLGAGNSVDAIMRSLRGSLSMSMPQGEVSGIDLDGLIRRGDASGNTTVFNGLSASGPIQAGVFRNTDLSVSIGPIATGGEGYVDLGAQTMDYLVTPVVRDVGDRETVSFPVRIKGPWSSLAIRPDLEAALNLENERKKLEEAARKEVEREKEKLRKQAEAEKEKLRKRAAAEAKKLEDRAKKKAAEAAQKAARKLKLDQDAAKRLEQSAKDALGKELNKGLRGLLGNN